MKRSGSRRNTAFQDAYAEGHDVGLTDYAQGNAKKRDPELEALAARVFRLRGLKFPLTGDGIRSFIHGYEQGWKRGKEINLGQGPKRIVNTKKKNAKRKPPKKRNAGPKKKSTRNAGLFSKRKTKKVRGKKGGDFDSVMKARSKATKKKRSAARAKGNPGAKLKANISGMKPGYWYDSSLQGAKVKVKRVGQSLIVKPASKRKR